ncbi:MAG: response regulator transcription factor [Alphaproteobacteria bacterium]|nr:response regulator transcription factor [Alphaproteobacteria bacterium]MBU0792568.1 response regulator transcription factor [Alphaproteobacteria bacterium]MBU0874777.1 response regulator transcription factor [Alphaproteobacteria bacterium]MBU1768635.1 response regulator transcription factor [Alphaproteobacteria bacterium]
MTNLLLIDDDAELSAMLREYLAEEGFALTVAGNGEDGVQQALTGRFEAVILDIMLPRMNGIEVLGRIRHASKVPVLMLTARGDDVDRVVGLELGADDYIAKPYYPRELLARLRAVLRRTGGPSPTGPLTITVLTLDPARRDARWDGRPIELTVTEFSLLEALMRAGDIVSTKDELSLAALGRQRQRYDRSIDVHVSNLRQKLSLASAGAAEIETIRGVGYRLAVNA